MKLGDRMDFDGHDYGHITSLVRSEGRLVQVGATKHHRNGTWTKQGFAADQDGTLHLMAKGEEG